MANKNQSAAYPSKVRAKWYFLVEKAGKTVAEVCKIYMISRKTYYKWKRKDLGFGKYISKILFHSAMIGFLGAIISDLILKRLSRKLAT